jgi:hypothetical protein
MEYARWLEEHNRQINELRSAVNAHAGDNELRGVVDKIMSHYEEIFKQKGNAAKADVFHVLSGMWKTPAERCFLWLGGFRPSELLKVCKVLRCSCCLFEPSFYCKAPPITKTNVSTIILLAYQEQIISLYLFFLLFHILISPGHCKLVL